ncbi:RNA-binding protein [Deltaproteobacteria bacterium Smac51]|nr:RNA-binding protein [Deltaproteobacteria bacterium Smac51]
MKELVTYLAGALATHPDEVAVTECAKDNGVVLELQVAAEDLTHVIGKQGRTARAMRSLLSAAGAKAGSRYFLKIMSGDETAETNESQDAPEDAAV